MKENVKRTLAYILAILLITLIISFIIGVISTFRYIVTGKLDSKTNINNVKTDLIYEKNSDNIKKLNIDISTSDLKIINSDKFQVKASDKIYDVKIKDEELKISEKENFNKIFIGINFNKKNKIELYIPENMKFEKVYINQGVSKSTIENINTDILEIDGGVGSLDIKNGNIDNLKLSAGVGTICIKAKYNNTAKIEAGVGSIKLDILNNKEDLDIKVEKGLGKISYNGKSLEDNQIKNGKVKFEIEGGVGSININN